MMTSAAFSEATYARTGLRKSLLVFTTASVLANVLLACVLLLKPTPVVTIIVPPEAANAEAGWVFTEKGVHPNYLERWSLAVTALVGTMSPSTMDANAAKLLALAAPEVHDEMERRLLREVESLRADRAASVFYPSRTRVDADHFTVDVEGERRVLIGSKVAGSERIVLRVRARYDAGRLYLLSLSEVPAAEAQKLFPA